MLYRSKADRVAMRLSLQFALEFFDLLKNPRIIGGMLSHVLLQPRLAAAQDPVDESAKQSHAYIHVHFSICEARPSGRKAVGSRASTTARRCGDCLFARAKMNGS